MPTGSYLALYPAISTPLLRLPAVNFYTASSLRIDAERSSGGCDERIGIPGRGGDSKDSSSEDEGDIREEPVGPEAGIERPFLRGEDPRSVGQEPNN